MGHFKRIVFAIVAPIVIAGCYAHSYGDGYYTTVSPPVTQVEVATGAPYAGAVWIDGYWGWGGERYVWHRGYWHEPRPGYVWERHIWARDGRGWRFHAGHWRRRM